MHEKNETPHMHKTHIKSLHMSEKHTETPLMQFKLLYKHSMKSVQIQEEMDQKKSTCLGTLHALKSSKPLQIAINCNRKTDLSGFNLPMV